VDHPDNDGGYGGGGPQLRAQQSMRFQVASREDELSRPHCAWVFRSYWPQPVDYLKERVGVKISDQVHRYLGQRAEGQIRCRRACGKQPLCGPSGAFSNDLGDGVDM
jgi:hypothetical protein